MTDEMKQIRIGKKKQQLKETNEMKQTIAQHREDQPFGG